MDNITDNIIDEYRSGKEVNYIADYFGITSEDIKEILLDLKESNRFKRTFTDDFKEIIADRDLSGVSRKQIASELEINPMTVKKACDKFGKKSTDRASSDDEHIKIVGHFKMNECPSCKSKKVNKIDLNTTYCLDCGDEHIFHLSEGYILKVNWSEID